MWSDDASVEVAPTKTETMRLPYSHSNVVEDEKVIKIVIINERI